MSNIKEVVEKIRSQVYVDDEPFKLTDEEAESLIRELVEKEAVEFLDWYKITILEQPKIYNEINTALYEQFTAERKEPKP